MQPNETTPADEGGEGGLRGDPAKRWLGRQHLRILEAAVYGGWQVPEEAYATIPVDLLTIASDMAAPTRDRVRAAEALSALAKSRVESAIQYDRIMRLEAGEATSRVAVIDGLSDQQIAAVAVSLQRTAPVPKPPAAPQEPSECPKPRRRARKA